VSFIVNSELNTEFQAAGQARLKQRSPNFVGVQRLTKSADVATGSIAGFSD